MQIDTDTDEGKEALKKLIDEQVAGLKSNRDELKDEKQKLQTRHKQEMDDLKKQLDGFQDKLGDLDPDKIQQLLSDEQQREEEAAKKAGEYDKLVAQLQEKHAKEIEEANNNGDKYKSALHKELLNTATLRGLEEHKGNSALLDHVVKGRLRIDETDSGVQIVALGEDGEPMLGEDGKAGTVSDVVAHLKTKDIYAPAFEGIRVGGSGAREEGGPGLGKNPFAKDSLNLTEQGKIINSNPVLAKRLQEEAAAA